LVAAMPTDERHFPIVESSKAWRRDMRTFVALANETVAAEHSKSSGSREVWGYYPDDNPLKGLHPGDTRAAIAPFMAHEVCDTARYSMSQHVTACHSMSQYVTVCYMHFHDLSRSHCDSLNRSLSKSYSDVLSRLPYAL